MCNLSASTSFNVFLPSSFCRRPTRCQHPFTAPLSPFSTTLSPPPSPTSPLPPPTSSLLPPPHLCRNRLPPPRHRSKTPRLRRQTRCHHHTTPQPPLPRNTRRILRPLNPSHTPLIRQQPSLRNDTDRLHSVELVPRARHRLAAVRHGCDFGGRAGRDAGVGGDESEEGEEGEEGGEVHCGGGGGGGWGCGDVVVRWWWWVEMWGCCGRGGKVMDR